MGIQPINDTMAGSTAVVRDSVFRENTEAGIFVLSSEATIEGVVVQDTNPLDVPEAQGAGIVVQALCLGIDGCRAPSTATVRNALLERNRYLGFMSSSSSYVLEDSVIRDTYSTPDGFHGDGIAVGQSLPDLVGEVSRVVVADNALAGLSLHGATIGLTDVTMQCNTLDLAGEPYKGREIDLDNRGGNACGCPAAAGGCKLQSGSGVTPPSPLPPDEGI
jgi:hypothetical protein